MVGLEWTKILNMTDLPTFYRNEGASVVTMGCNTKIIQNGLMTWMILGTRILGNPRFS